MEVRGGRVRVEETETEGVEHVRSEHVNTKHVTQLRKRSSNRTIFSANDIMVTNARFQTISYLIVEAHWFYILSEIFFFHVHVFPLTRHFLSSELRKASTSKRENQGPVCIRLHTSSKFPRAINRPNSVGRRGFRERGIERRAAGRNPSSTWAFQMWVGTRQIRSNYLSDTLQPSTNQLVTTPPLPNFERTRQNPQLGTRLLRSP